MERVFFKGNQRDWYFKNIKEKSHFSWQEIARICKVSLHTLFDWRRGKYSIPLQKIDIIRKEFGITPSLSYKKRQKYWYIKKASKLGGLARNEKHGNPGTPEGRIRGGRNSARRGPVFFPRRSTLLAEFIGVMLGDGGISKYQSRITLDIKRDKEYVFFVAGLIEKLFKIKPSVYRWRKRSTCVIVVSSVDLVKFLVRQGLVIGNKIKQSIRIPSWLFKKKIWQFACIRGIFDTDGSIFLDKHRIKGREYKNLGMVFTSHSVLLIKDISRILENYGYNPTISCGKQIFIRKEREIKRYFREIGTSNTKHNRRFKAFLQERYQSGHTGTASKADRE